MAKRRAQKRAKQRGIKEVLISLGILFSSILFIVKLIMGSIGWLEVFAPILIAFFIVFLLTVLKSIFNKI